MTRKLQDANKNEKKQRGISIEKKIEIFREYKQKIGLPINISTKYKGYNIGIWRSNLREQEHKEKLPRDVTEEMKNELISLGVLGNRKVERRISDEEKINAIEAFAEEHPDVPIKLSIKSEEGIPIGKYLSHLKLKYNRQVKTGEQILKPDILKRLKEKNFYETKKEEEIKKLIERFGIEREDATPLIEKYGSVKETIKAHKEGIEKISSKIKMGGCILVNSDIDDPRIEEAYRRLGLSIFGKEHCGQTIEINGHTYKRILVIDKKQLDTVLQNLKPREIEILKKNFGLEDGIKRTLDEIGKEQNVYASRIMQIIQNALVKLRYDSIDWSTKIEKCSEQIEQKIEEAYQYYWSDEYSLVIDEKNKKIDMGMEKQKSNTEAVFNDDTDIFKIGFEVSTCKCLYRNGLKTWKDIKHMKKSDFIKIDRIGKKKANEIMQKIERYRKLEGENIQPIDDEIDIVKLGISKNTCAILNANGYKSWKDIKDITEDDLIEIKGIGKNKAKKIIDKIKEYTQPSNKVSENKYGRVIEDKSAEDGISEIELKENEKEKQEEIINDETPINYFGFSVRAYHALRRKGYKVWKDIKGLTEEEFLKIRNIGIKTVKEIMEKIAKYQQLQNSSTQQLEASIQSDEDKIQLEIEEFNKMSRELALIDEKIEQVMSENRTNEETKKLQEQREEVSYDEK